MSATSWQPVTIDAANDVGGWSSVAVDGHGRVHISYNTQAAAAALRYATCAARCGLAGSWQAATVDETEIGVGFWTSVAIDGNGRVHVSYVDVTAGGSLKYIQ